MPRCHFVVRLRFIGNESWHKDYKLAKKDCRSRVLALAQGVKLYHREGDPIPHFEVIKISPMGDETLLYKCDDWGRIIP